jgi:hypothetical protein
MLLFMLGCRQLSTVTSVKSAVLKPALNALADIPRQRIESWVKLLTDTASADFIPVADRIAVFDNDGKLWSEQPAPFQLVFAIDNLNALAPNHPEWQKDTVIINGVIKGDMERMKKAGLKGLMRVMDTSHSGQTEDAFSTAVRNWIETAKHEKFNRVNQELIYQPMVELLPYLRAHDFNTFIVSGGGADFMRVWSEEAYGIPPYQVIGSYGDARYDLVNGKPLITKTGGEIYLDDKAGKSVAIHRFIGKVPVFCCGNSDGDQAMMQCTIGSKYKCLYLIIHRTDSVREFQYDLKTLSGHLETALAEAKEKNWLVLDMQKDFREIFGFQSSHLWPTQS